MKKRFSQSPLIALTILAGVLGFPLAYYACVDDYRPSIERLTWCGAIYASSMLAGAVLGELLELYLRRRGRRFEFGVSFIAVTLVVLFLEIFLLLAILPVR